MVQVQAGLSLWRDPGGFALLDAPGHLVSTLSSLAFHVPSCDLAQGRGLPALRKIAWSWEAALQSQASRLGAKHLHYATWKAPALHSWDAYTLRDLCAHLSPQPPLLLKFTFLKEVQELHHPRTSPFFFFLKETPCIHLPSLTGRPTCELIPPLSGMTGKSQMLGDKRFTRSMLKTPELGLSQDADFLYTVWHCNIITCNYSTRRAWSY